MEPWKWQPTPEFFPENPVDRGAWQDTSMGSQRIRHNGHTCSHGRGWSLEERIEFWSGFCYKFILRPWVNHLTSLGSGGSASVWNGWTRLSLRPRSAPNSMTVFIKQPRRPDSKFLWGQEHDPAIHTVAKSTDPKHQNSLPKHVRNSPGSQHM